MILIRLTLFFALGIFLGRFFGLNALYALTGFPFLALILLLPSRITGRFPKFIPLLLIGLAVACMGTALVLAKGIKAGNSVTGLVGKTVKLELTAMEYSKSTPFGKKVLAQVNGSGNAKLSGGMLLYMNDNAPQLRPGDQVNAVVQVRELKSRYPGYLKYLNDKGIEVSGSMKTLCSTSSPKGLFAPVDGLRNSLNASLHKLMPDKLISGLAAAMLLGDRSNLDPELKESFSKAGLSHILAISGLHVGIVFGFFQFALSFLTRGPRGVRIQTLLSLGMLLIYMILTGCSPAVCRAVLMIFFYQSGKLFFLQPHSLSSLAAACLVLLAYDPYMLFQVGFQLSFAAVTGILVFAPIMQEKLEKRLGKWGRESMVRSAVVCLAAQVLTSPLIAWHFGQFPTYFLFANLLLLPLVAFSVNLGAIALFFCWIPGLNQALFGMLDFCLWALTKVGNWFGSLPGAVVEAASFTDSGFCILLAIALVILALWHGKLVVRKLRFRGKAISPSLQPCSQQPA